jgi:zinc D-Ala-D-Ala carboxypeptidase
VRLTAHFASREFASHDGAPTPARYLTWARQLCAMYLEPLRTEFGPVVVISGHRSVAHNRAVGGAPRSYHLSIKGRRGAAADIRCSRGTADDWADFLDRRGIPGLGRYDGHVHADNRAGRARW